LLFARESIVMIQAMTLSVTLVCLSVILGCSAVRSEAADELSVVPRVEIARYPNRFQKECVSVTADYSLRDNGKIRVVNACRKGSPDGPIKRIEGKAWVVGRETNAKLRVQFFWPCPHLRISKVHLPVAE
jgi:lipocalin